jgi:threonine dehydrogenase-like Zn-dependent dehydrogenase
VLLPSESPLGMHRTFAARSAMFDKQINLRMGQANVKRWIKDILPLLTGDEDPLGVDDYATHHLPIDDAPRAYDIFQKKQDGAFKILLQPA